MTPRRHLIPLLTAVLVIQSLVAVAPHTHGSETADIGPGAGGVDAAASIDVTAGSHQCLACTVHAPVVVQAAEGGISTGLAIAVTAAIDGGSSSTLPVLTSGGPRGPPRVV